MPRGGDSGAWLRAQRRAGRSAAGRTVPPATGRRNSRGERVNRPFWARLHPGVDRPDWRTEGLPQNWHPLDDGGSDWVLPGLDHGREPAAQGVVEAPRPEASCDDGCRGRDGSGPLLFRHLRASAASAENERTLAQRAWKAGVAGSRVPRGTQPRPIGQLGVHTLCARALWFRTKLASKFREHRQVLAAGPAVNQGHCVPDKGKWRPTQNSVTSVTSMQRLQTYAIRYFHTALMTERT